MIKIIHQQDPTGSKAPSIWIVDEDTNILKWLKENFQDSHDLCGDLACSFVLNGKEIFRTDHEEVNQKLLDIALYEGDQLVMVNRPAGIESVIIIAIAAIVIAAALTVYMLNNLPGTDTSSANTSSNNKLNGATNEFRPRMALPECFGFGISYPDFIQPTFYGYENNKKKQTGLFLITAGSAEIGDVRIGDTNINILPGSSAEVFSPGNIPDAEFLVKHQPSSSIDGQVLMPPSDSSIQQSRLLVWTNNGDGTLRIAIPTAVADDLAFNLGGYIYIRSGLVNGVFLIKEYFANDVFGDDMRVTIESSSVASGSHITLIAKGDPWGVIGDGTAGKIDYYIGPFTLAGKEVEEVHIHWRAPAGIRDENGNKITVVVLFEIRNEKTLEVLQITGNIQGKTLDPQFRTTKFTSSDFPSMVPGEYSCRARRLTGFFDDNAIDQMKLEGFVSVTPYSVTDFGDATVLLVQRRATTFSPDQSGKKINCDYRRMLPSYNRTTGAYDLTDLVATDSFADAVAYTLIPAGGETVDTVDLAGLYAIYDGLLHSELGGFTFTFDDADILKGSRVESICNVARVVPMHDGSQWLFARDEAKALRSAMFNRRSVSGADATQQWQPQRADDADSVRVSYVEDSSNTERFIVRGFNLSTGAINDTIGVYPIDIVLAGCRDIFQAENRADLEIRRIAYQRRTVTETTYRDALDLSLLDRVGWVDINDIDTFDGEIMGVTGTSFDTSEGFYPDTGVSYVVYVTGADGSPCTPVTCTARTDTDFGFVATGLTGIYLANDSRQVGSRYFIANNDDLGMSEFSLTSRTPNSDGTVSVSLTEYDARLFERDFLAPLDERLVVDGDDGGAVPIQINIYTHVVFAAPQFAAFFDSTAGLLIKPDGTIRLMDYSSEGADDEVIEWFTGGVTPGIGDDYEMYRTEVSFVNAFSNTTGEGTALYDLDTLITLETQKRGWITARVHGADYPNPDFGYRHSKFDFYIREISNPANIAYYNVSMLVAMVENLADVQGNVTEFNLPANYLSGGVLVRSSPRIDFSSNGDIVRNLGLYNNYPWCTLVPGVGAYYEIRATNLTTGVLELGVLDTWENLGNSVVYSVSQDTIRDATIDVEIREIADITNNVEYKVNFNVAVGVNRL